ncbi:hypothetical protein JR316_0003479 [Psilocybe cubensis]|nr:hypothetical protein JR316_0003479 [Psilocybe cubensis]KAH9484001.1 hypothetical protein JR316_0003479 [Psilocybe cubensis]
MESEDFDQGDTTLCSMEDSSVMDFTPLFSHDSSVDFGKANFKAAYPSSIFDSFDMDKDQCTLLVQASARISEILRENRRRLDSGEDLCISRREARRKRAQEISAARKTRHCLL